MTSMGSCRERSGPGVEEWRPAREWQSADCERAGIGSLGTGGRGAELEVDVAGVIPDDGASWMRSCSTMSSAGFG